ncbi:MULTISPECIES: hypothetical protein [unclassified Leucobacter]|uniref:hypothetical protein n=1 Tax=unclassified Leucobacter TaxID=2621730 RepID=UPI00165DEB92|nr:MULTISPECIES: hypothetical protein [unclassified Leucobacter]MBC9926223.1 hypothetical protein [Leucobacter sp. cx-169]
MKFSSPRGTRRSIAQFAAAAAGAALLLGLTACAPAGKEDVQLKTADFETALIDWRDQMDGCMLDAGFDMTPTGGDSESTGTIDTSQFDMVEFEKAYAACTKQVGEAPVDESLPTEDEMFETQLIFAQCMREAGYDYPDPVRGSGGMTQAFGPETNPDDIDTCSAQAEAGAQQ